jgi:hypothetical protein
MFTSERIVQQRQGTTGRGHNRRRDKRYGDFGPGPLVNFESRETLAIVDLHNAVLTLKFSDPLDRNQTSDRWGVLCVPATPHMTKSGELAE